MSKRTATDAGIATDQAPASKVCLHRALSTNAGPHVRNWWWSVQRTLALLATWLDGELRVASKLTEPQEDGGRCVRLISAGLLVGAPG